MLEHGERMEPGDFVSHPSLGIGIVVRAHGTKIEVRFESNEILTLLATAVTRIGTEALPADMAWRLRKNGKGLAASIERIRPKSPAVTSAFASLLSNLAAILPEERWEVPGDDSETLYIRSAVSSGKSRRIAFTALDEKPSPHIVVAVIDIKRLPDDFKGPFALRPKGFFGKDYLRAELTEDKLAQLPTMMSAMRALVARNP